MSEDTWSVSGKKPGNYGPRNNTEFQKRRRTMYDPESLEFCLYTTFSSLEVFSNEGLFEDTAKKICDLLVSNGKLLLILTDLISTSPHKATESAALIILTSFEARGTAEAILDSIQSVFLDAIDNKNTRVLYSLLRLYGEFTRFNSVSHDDLFDSYEALLEVLSVHSKKWNNINVAMCSIVLALVVYTGCLLQPSNKQRLSSIISRISIFADESMVKEAMTRMQTNCSNQYPVIKEFCHLTGLLNLVKLFHEQEWASSLPFFSRSVPAKLMDRLVLKIPIFTVKSWDPRGFYWRPRTYLNFYGEITDNQDTGRVVYPPPDTIDRWIVQERAENLVYYSHMTPDECVSQIVNYSLAESMHHQERAFFEYIFTELLEPCRPTLKLQSIITLAIRVCRDSRLRPSPISVCFNETFKNLHSVNPLAYFRFMSYFSSHLTNFKFAWNWVPWDEKIAASQDPENLHRVFYSNMVQSIFEHADKSVIQQKVGDNWLKFWQEEERVLIQDTDIVPAALMTVLKLTIHNLSSYKENLESHFEDLSVLNVTPPLEAGPRLSEMKIKILAATLLSAVQTSLELFSEVMEKTMGFLSKIQKYSPEILSKALCNYIFLYHRNFQVFAYISTYLLYCRIISVPEFIERCFHNSYIPILTSFNLWNLIIQIVETGVGPKEDDRHIILQSLASNVIELLNRRSCTGLERNFAVSALFYTINSDPYVVGQLIPKLEDVEIKEMAEFFVQ